MNTTGINRINRNAVQKLGDGMHCDGDHLYLQVRGAARSWVVRGPRINGRKPEVGLGSAHRVSIDVARKERDKLLEQWKDGKDPIAERRAAKEAEARRKTFAQVAEEVIENRQSSWERSELLDRQSTLIQWRRDIDVICKSIAGKWIDDITVENIENLLRPFWDRGHHARAKGLRGRIEAVFNYAYAKRWTTRDNPASWRVFEHLTPPKTKRKRNHASLPWTEVPAFIERLHGSDAVSARILEFAILTAARSQEARGARWSEINWERKVWTVPGTRMKKRLKHEVPLSAQAIALLERMQVERVKSAGDFVFPGGRGSAQSNGKSMQNQSLWTLVQRLVNGADAEATVHGFRSSFTIWAKNNGVDKQLADRCLAHEDGDETDQAYGGIARDQLTEPRRPIMEAWGAFVDAARDNVLPFERRAA
jgi:integrase